MTTLLVLAKDSDQTLLPRRVEDSIDSALRRYEEEFGCFSGVLNALLERGISPAVYSAYRDNYLYRTATTFSSLVKALNAAAAADEPDEEIVSLLVQTIYEESGDGGKQASHYRLLFDSHNFHGDRMFGLPPADSGSLGRGVGVTAEVIAFRQCQSALYGDPDLARVMGAFLAQESTAEAMLRAFYETFFEPFRSAYRDKGLSYSIVENYFSAHLDGTERSHALRARTCAARVCRNEHDLKSLERGMAAFLDAQLGLWSGLARLWGCSL